MTTPTSELHQLHQTSPFIELYTIDATHLNGSVYRFTPNVLASGSYVVFQTNTYIALPIMTDGWELTATGAQPRPTLAISNVNKILLDAVVTQGDLVGAKVTRMRTFAKFLDGEPTADPNAYIDPVDVYYIEQKVAHNNKIISWQLASPVEAFGQKLPRRQFLKDVGFPGISRYRGAL